MPEIVYKIMEPEDWGGLCELFATNRECQLCWCMNHRRPPAAEVQGEAAKVALKEQVDTGRACSVLAYDGDRCIGWCAVDPVAEQPGHDYNHWKHAETSDGLWSIHCLYVHPESRGKGVSTRLIAVAVEAAKARAAKRLLAFPIPEEMRKHFPVHDGEFSGRMSSFRKLGFKPAARINDFYQVMALDLT